MTESKKILLRKKKLAAWANAVVNHELFDELVAHTRAHLMESASIPVEQQRGIATFLQALREVTRAEDDTAADVQSGLIQDLNPDHARQIRQQIEKAEATPPKTKKG